MKFWLFGSENRKYPSKLHLCDDNSKVLCGMKHGYWMEATCRVAYENNELRYDEHTLERVDIWDKVGCKKCKKKLECAT